MATNSAKGAKTKDTATKSTTNTDPIWNRFMSHVVIRKDGVHEWVGAKTKEGGYGLFKDPTTKKLMPAHRFAWEYKYGKMPDRLDVCHQNDFPADVNTDNLFVASRSTNLKDAARKGRLADRKPRGKAISKGEIAHIKHRLTIGHSLSEIGRDLNRSVGNLSNLRRRQNLPKEGLLQTLEKADKALDKIKADLKKGFPEAA